MILLTLKKMVSSYLLGKFKVEIPAMQLPCEIIQCNKNQKDNHNNIPRVPSTLIW